MAGGQLRSQKHSILTAPVLDQMPMPILGLSFKPATALAETSSSGPWSSLPVVVVLSWEKSLFSSWYE